MSAKKISNAVIMVLAAVSFLSLNSFAQNSTPGKYDEFVHKVLPNGLELIIKYNPDSRVFAVNILGKNRSANEPDGKDGITDFVNRMMLQGAAGLDATAIQQGLDDIGAEITANDNPYIPYDDRYTNRMFSFIKFETIDEYAYAGTNLLYKIISKPDFAEPEIEKTRKKVAGILGMSSGSTYQACRDLWYKTIFDNHPFRKQEMGNMMTVAGFTRDDLVTYHRHYYAPNNLIMAVATNINPDTILHWLNATFGTLPWSTESYPTIDPPSNPIGLKEVHKELDKEQIYIYMGGILPGLNSPDAAAINMASVIISSRMGLNLREKQGLAYSVGMGTEFMPEFGWFVASMGTGYQNYDKAKPGMLAQINELKNTEPTAEELKKAQNSTWGSMLLARASRINQAYYMCRNQFLGVGYDYEDDYISKIRAVTPADIKRVVAAYFDTDNMVIATAGKKIQ